MAPKKDMERPPEPPDGAGEQRQAAVEHELVVAVLKARLGRYQEAGERLAVEGFRLTDELARQKVTLQDVNEFLTNELKARSVVTAQLEERVLELQGRLLEVQREAQAEVARARAEAAAEVAVAATQAQALTGQPDGSEELLEHRAQLEGQVEKLRVALAAKAKEYEHKLSDLERRHLQDKERMRQDLASRIRETKSAMSQLADQHLESSTKRTLAENEAMVAELGFHASQTTQLLAANDALRAELAEMRRQLGIAHATAESTARKSLMLQQTIKAILQSLQKEGASGVGSAAAAAAASGDCRAHRGHTTGVMPCHPDAVGPAGDGAAAGQQEQQQQEQEQEQEQQGQQHEQTPLPATAGAIVDHLERRVLALADELAAARQALAAALQGLLPQDGSVHVVVLDCPQAARWQQPQGGAQPGQPACCPATNLSAAAAPSHALSSRGAQGLPRASQAGSRSPGAAVGMAAALRDGVAPFVLHCVRHLRRCTHALAAAPGEGPRTAGSPGNVQQAASPSRQPKGSPRGSACGAAALLAAVPAALVAAGGGRHSHSPGTWDCCSPCTSEASMREQLAQMLLAQLHTYAPHELEAYQGLAMCCMPATGGLEPGPQAGPAAAPDSPQGEGRRPNGPPLGAAAQHRQQQPREPQPLPLAASSLPCAAAAPVNGAVPARAPADGLPSTEELFAALLGDARARGGGGGGACGGSLRSRSASPGKAASGARLLRAGRGSPLLLAARQAAAPPRPS